MATVHCTAFLAVAIIVVVLQSHVAYTADDLSSTSLIAPFFGDACNGTDVCGRGTCVPSTNTTAGFACECEPGWRQARPVEDSSLEFLPCVVPNCTLNYTCAYTGPNPDDQRGANFSIFDPCYWADCGGGRCNSTSPFTHTCECEEGYYNLLNSTIFACYKPCAYGANCPTLGFNTSIPNNPFLPEFNQAVSLIPRAEFACLVTMVATLARIVWKYT